MNFLRRALPLRSIISGGVASSARRFFYSDSRPALHHFRSRRTHWYHDRRKVLAIALLGGGGAVTLYYGNLEEVPYTRRRHFLLISSSMERQLGETQFNQLKESLRGKILAPAHPDSVRVRLIAKELVSAIQRGLRHDRPGWSDMQYSRPPSRSSSHRDQEEHTLLVLRGSEDVRWGRADEVLDDRWVSEEKRGSQLTTTHLEGINWEVIVVRDKMMNAMCLPGGKIVVFTGLLDHFRSDVEIATVMGHEIAHAVSRHAAESITKNLWFALIQIILLQFFYMPDVVNAMSNLLLRLPFSRRMEMEADYVGLLLLASAGYDPRFAPKVYEKMGEVTGDSALKDYISTHPSSKKRAKLLSEAKVMEEAMVIYRGTKSGRGIEGFL